MTVTLRIAAFNDAPAIANLHATSWRFAYRGAYPDDYLDGSVFEDRARVWNERLSSPPANQYVVLAEDGGDLAGFACAYGEDDERWGTLLDNLHVRPDAHRQGTGRRLVVAVAAWVSERYPGRPMYLWVLEQNERARHFYASVGGVEHDTKASQTPGGGTTSAIRVAWSADQLPIK